MNGRFIQLDTVFGLTVEFDGSSRATVKVPEVYGGEVEGICADFDGNPNNDLTTKEGVDVSGETNKYTLVGESWQVDDPTDPA